MRKRQPFDSHYYKKIDSSKYHAPTKVSISVKEKELPQCKKRKGTEVRFVTEFEDKVEKATWELAGPFVSTGSNGTTSVNKWFRPRGHT